MHTVTQPDDNSLPPPDAIPYFGGLYREAYALQAALWGLPPVPRGVLPAA